MNSYAPSTGSHKPDHRHSVGPASPRPSPTSRLHHPPSKRTGYHPLPRHKLCHHSLGSTQQQSTTTQTTHTVPAKQRRRPCRRRCTAEGQTLRVREPRHGELSSHQPPPHRSLCTAQTPRPPPQPRGCLRRKRRVEHRYSCTHTPATTHQSYSFRKRISPKCGFD